MKTKHFVCFVVCLAFLLGACSSSMGNGPQPRAPILDAATSAMDVAKYLDPNQICTALKSSTSGNVVWISIAGGKPRLFGAIFDNSIWKTWLTAKEPDFEGDNNCENYSLQEVKFSDVSPTYIVAIGVHRVAHKNPQVTNALDIDEETDWVAVIDISNAQNAHIVYIKPSSAWLKAISPSSWLLEDTNADGYPELQNWEFYQQGGEGQGSINKCVFPVNGQFAEVDPVNGMICPPIQPVVDFCHNAYWPIVKGAEWDYAMLRADETSYYGLKVVQLIPFDNGARGGSFTINVTCDNAFICGQSGPQKYICNDKGIFTANGAMILPPESEIVEDAVWQQQGYALSVFGFEDRIVPAGTFNTAIFGTIPNPPGADYYAKGVGEVEAWVEPNTVLKLVSFDIPGINSAKVVPATEPPVGQISSSTDPSSDSRYILTDMRLGGKALYDYYDARRDGGAVDQALYMWDNNVQICNIGDFKRELRDTWWVIDIRTNQIADPSSIVLSTDPSGPCAPTSQPVATPTLPRVFPDVTQVSPITEPTLASCETYGLTEGMYVMVSTDPPVSNRVRSWAGLSYPKITDLKPGTVVLVASGSICADGMVWHRVAWGNNGINIGWTAEGGGNERWLIPTGQQAQFCGTIPRVCYILADIQLGGPSSYYEKHPEDPSSMDAVARWTSGTRVVNIGLFERKKVNGTWAIVLKDTNIQIVGSEALLNK